MQSEMLKVNQKPAVRVGEMRENVETAQEQLVAQQSKKLNSLKTNTNGNIAFTNKYTIITLNVLYKLTSAPGLSWSTSSSL